MFILLGCLLAGINMLIDPSRLVCQLLIAERLLIVKVYKKDQYLASRNSSVYFTLVSLIVSLYLYQSGLLFFFFFFFSCIYT